MADLHALVCEYCIGIMKSGEVDTKDLAVIVRFLKDNGTVAEGAVNEEALQDLRDAVPEEVWKLMPEAVQ